MYDYYYHLQSSSLEDLVYAMQNDRRVDFNVVFTTGSLEKRMRFYAKIFESLFTVCPLFTPEGLYWRPKDPFCLTFHFKD